MSSIGLRSNLISILVIFNEIDGQGNVGLSIGFFALAGCFANAIVAKRGHTPPCHQLLESRDRGSCAFAPWLGDGFDFLGWRGHPSGLGLWLAEDI